MVTLAMFAWRGHAAEESPTHDVLQPAPAVSQLTPMAPTPATLEAASTPAEPSQETTPAMTMEPSAVASETVSPDSATSAPGYSEVATLETKPSSPNGGSPSVTAGSSSATPSDHEMSGRFGFGVGFLQEPAFSPIVVVDPETSDDTTDTTDDTTPIPAIILRYWFGERKSWAIELGVTYVDQDFQVEGDAATQGEESYFHTRLGAPIVVASTQHTTFELIPQVSFLTGHLKTSQQEFTLSQWGAAVRLVAELHFGFIGVPELSLQSGVGMHYSRLALKARTQSLISLSQDEHWRLVVTNVGPVGGQGPWDIFVGNLSALYHF